MKAEITFLGNGAHGTINGATWTKEKLPVKPTEKLPLMTQEKIEQINNVLTFDGIDDWLELPKGFPTIEKAITIEFWAKGENSLTECNTIFEANNAENTRVLVVAIPWDRRIYWDAGNGNGFDRIDKEVKIEEYNSWTHWAFVKDVAAGKMWIYRNGQIWEQGEGTQKSLAGIDRVTIGCLVNNSAFWKGSLTEFRIWNQVRTQAEILQNINVRLKGNEQGLSRYYPFNGDANDRTSNGAHGTINGATWTQDNKIPITNHRTKEIKQDSMMTGLSDYYFWMQKVTEEHEARKEPDPPFRRGRIWA